MRASDVETRAVAVIRETVGIVGSGPSDQLWELHGSITRQFLAAGGVSADEIAEWLAAQERREQAADS